MGQQLLAVMLVRGRNGKLYRSAMDADYSVFDQANDGGPALPTTRLLSPTRNRRLIGRRPILVVFSAVVRYGFTKFGDLFNARQGVALTTLAYGIQRAFLHLSSTESRSEYARAVVALLGCNLDRLADLANSLCRFEPVAAVSPAAFRSTGGGNGVGLRRRSAHFRPHLLVATVPRQNLPILNDLRSINDTPAVVHA